MNSAKDKEGGTKLADKSKTNRLKMYKTRPIRDRKGKILYEAFKSKDLKHEARIEPNRRWFLGTRTVGQKELIKFREAMEEFKADPKSILLKPSKIPFSLLTDVKPKSKVLFDSFSSIIGKTATRKRPNLNVTDVDDYISATQKASEQYKVEDDVNIVKPKDEEFFRQQSRECIYSKGQSNRIWSELYKVVDCSDVVIEVLDARDPMGTRCFHIEKHIQKNCPTKHLLLLLNKADLVPVWSLARWISILSKSFPVIAFHASINKPFGKGSLIQVLRQFQRSHLNKPQISVGFVGYPNVGKSSVINALRHKRVCPAAPIPGYTKVWQYITLFKNILLVDCPGVVYPSNDTESDIVLKGVVRIENLHDTPDHVEEIIKKTSSKLLTNIYKVSKWDDHIDFLTQLAYKYGQLLPQNKPNIHGMAKIVLRDWLNGKIPYFVPPPMEGDSNSTETTITATVKVPRQILKKLSTRQEFVDHEVESSPQKTSLKVTHVEDNDSLDHKAGVCGDVDWDQIYEDELECASSESIDNLSHSDAHDSSSSSAEADSDCESQDYSNDNPEESDQEFNIQPPSEKLTKISMKLKAPRHVSFNKKKPKTAVEDSIQAEQKIIQSGLKHFRRSDTIKGRPKKKRRNNSFKIVKLD